MIYLFEDDKRDIINIFFRNAYPYEISNTFEYAGGNGNVEQKTKDLLNGSSDDIVVFLDMPPGNDDAVRIYYKMRRLSRANNYRVIIIPIICSEYCLIKSLINSQVLISNTGIDICINKDLYVNSPLIQSNTDKKFVKTFEKYCKLILIKNLKYCAKHTGKITKQYYGAYYTRDCICAYNDNNCSEEYLIHKATRFIAEYPCAPSGSYATNYKRLTSNNIWDIHRELVDEYNIDSARLSKKDTTNSKKYKNISRIK